MEKNKKSVIVGLCLTVVIVVVLAAFQYRANTQEQLALQQKVIQDGISLYEQAMYEQAMLAFEAVPGDSSQDWRLPYYKGATLVRLKDYERAVVQLEAAKNLNSSEPQILYLLGVVYYKLGKLDLAEGYFTATLELDPSHEHAKGLIGVMVNLQQYQKQGNETSESEDPANKPGPDNEKRPHQ